LFDATTLYGHAYAVEHLIPLARGGSSERNNLWLACVLCNGHKGIQTHALDLITNQSVTLFNPRHQDWYTHFTWSQDGTHIIGLTPVGRATVVALKLNNDHLVRARRRWVAAGWHPPEV
jgi:HNH endonuclease